MTFRLFVNLLAVCGLLFVFGCSQQSEVVNGSWIQKRKYTQGFHLQKASRDHKKRSLAENERAVQEKDTAKVNADRTANLSAQAEMESAHPLREQRNVTPETSSASSEANTAPSEAKEATDLNRKEIRRAVKAAENTESGAVQEYYATRRVEGLSLASFLVAIVGLLVATIILAPTAAILGIIGLSKINKYPDMYSGRGFAIAGIIIGIVGLILILAYFSTL